MLAAYNCVSIIVDNTNKEKKKKQNCVVGTSYTV